MFRGSTFAALVWMLAIAVLPIRMANAHLHVCMDGQETPVSLRVQALATHAGAVHEEEGRDDRDVDFSASVLTAKLSGGVDDVSLALVHVYVLAFLLPIERIVFSSIDPPNHDLSFVVTFRPPVRGPPA